MTAVASLHPGTGQALLEEKLTPGLQHRILKALEHTAWPIEIFKVLVAQIERGLAYDDVSKTH